jgi:hypothetical protein
MHVICLAQMQTDYPVPKSNHGLVVLLNRELEMNNNGKTKSRSATFQLDYGALEHF